MSSCLFQCTIQKINTDTQSLVLRLSPTQEFYEISLTKAFFLKTFVLDADWNNMKETKMYKDLAAEATALDWDTQQTHLENLSLCNQYIHKVRVRHLHNYIDWQKSQTIYGATSTMHEAVYLLFRKGLSQTTTSSIEFAYDVEVFFTSADCLMGLREGTVFDSYQSDSTIFEIKDWLAEDESNIYELFNYYYGMYRFAPFLLEKGQTAAQNPDAAITYTDLWDTIGTTKRYFVSAPKNPEKEKFSRYSILYVKDATCWATVSGTAKGQAKFAGKGEKLEKEIKALTKKEYMEVSETAFNLLCATVWKEDLAVIQVGSAYGLINREGKAVLTVVYAVPPMIVDSQLVVVFKASKFGAVNLQTNIIIRPFEYSSYDEVIKSL